MTTTCPDAGTLRAYIDHEAPEHDQITQHVRSCLPCTRTIRTLRAQAATTASAMNALDRATPVQAAAVGTPNTVEPPARRRFGRSARALMAAASVGAVTVVTLSTPAGRAVAANALDVFRSKAVVGVEVTSADAELTMQAFSSLGAPVAGNSEDYSPTMVKTLDQAKAMVRLDVATPAANLLPAGMDDVPDEIAVFRKSEMTFVFSEAKTRAHLKQYGSENMTIPAGYDGTKLVVTFPDAVGVIYAKDGAKDQSSAIVVGTAAPVEARTDKGLSLTQLQDFLLGLPDIPKPVVYELSQMDIAKGGLPIPVIGDYVKGDETKVNGHPAVRFRAAGTAAYIVHDGPRIVGVGGMYDDDVVKPIAQQIAR